jgi:RNA polymerase sigma-70 factor (ECF subfamily)
MSGPREDWRAVLQDFERGDRLAIAKISEVVTGFLARYRAYDQRDSWADVTQEALLRILRAQRAGRLKDPQALVAFLGVVVKNLLADLARDRKKPGNPNHEEPSPDREEAQPVTDPDLVFDVRRGLAALPEKERLVVSALYLDGLSYEAASTRLGMPLGTLKRMQTQGLRALREILGVSSRRARSDPGAPESLQ